MEEHFNEEEGEDAEEEVVEDGLPVLEGGVVGRALDEVGVGGA